MLLLCRILLCRLEYAFPPAYLLASKPNVRKELRLLVGGRFSLEPQTKHFQPSVPGPLIQQAMRRGGKPC